MTDRLRLMANSSNEGWSKFGAELSLLGSGIDDNDWRQQAPIVSCRTSVCGLRHSAQNWGEGLRSRAKVGSCALRQSASKNARLAHGTRACLDRPLCRKQCPERNSLACRAGEDYSRSSGLRATAGVAAAALRICRGASRRYGLVSETENTCRGKDGRLHLAAFFQPFIFRSWGEAPRENNAR